MTACSSSFPAPFIRIHYQLLSGWGKVISNRSVRCGPLVFWQAASEGLKGNRDLCAPGKSIESDYLEREQVGSQGGPCHVYNLSLPLAGAIAVSPVSAVSGWLESSTAQTERSQPPDKPSRDAAPQQASAQGQAYFVSLPARRMGPFSAQSGTILYKRLQGQWYIAALWDLQGRSSFI